MRELAVLRYRLLWANFRTRKGRTVLLVVGIVLLAVFAVLVSLGGLASALMAIRKGKAEEMAQVVLSLLFVQAIVVTNLTGFGMNAVFSDLELRRYPLTSRERFMVRHTIAIVDPFWFMYLVFYLGLAVGLAMFGTSWFISAMSAAVLLFLCNYVAARVVDLGFTRVAALKAGSEILIVAAMIALMAFTLWENLRDLEIWHWLAYTPGFAAGRAMTGGGIGMLLPGWVAALILALIWLERNPIQQRRAAAGGIGWDQMADRIGECFGSRLGPLVAFWLRFNWRNRISRRLLWLALPVPAFLAYAMYKQNHPRNPFGLFLTALGALPVAAQLGAGRILVNQFGSLGGGFRRLLLLPVPAAFLVRSAFAASMVRSVCMMVLGLVVWVVASPYKFDWRMIVMLSCSGLTGMFLLHAAAVWVTVFNPSKGNYFIWIGNDLSWGANVAFMAGPLAGVFAPGIVRLEWTMTPEAWPDLLPFPPMAAVVYVASMWVGGRALAGQREKLLAVVEGK